MSNVPPGVRSGPVTGEAVVLDLRPAALPSRTVAAAIDALLQLLLMLALGIAVFVLGGGSEAADAALGTLVLVTGLVVYPVAFETALRGRTPGKAALGLRVVRDDGGPVGFRQALVRGLCAAALERPGITVFFGAVVTSLLHPQGKRLGDLLAGTVVLQERVPGRSTAPSTVPAPLVPWAASLDLSGLPEELVRSARAFLSRSADLTPQAREDLGSRLVADVLARTSPPPPPDAPGWAVLTAVVAERTRRASLRLEPEPAPAPPLRPGYRLPGPAVLPPPPEVPVDTPASDPGPPSSGSGFSVPR